MLRQTTFLEDVEAVADETDEDTIQLGGGAPGEAGSVFNGAGIAALIVVVILVIGGAAVAVKRKKKK